MSVKEAETRRPLAKPQEVADFYQVPESRLRNWRYLGTGPAYCKVGGLVRYRWADVEAWVDEQSGTAA